MKKETVNQNYSENKELYEKVYRTYQKVSDDREYLNSKSLKFLERVEEYVDDGLSEIQAMKRVAKEMLDEDLEKALLESL